MLPHTLTWLAAIWISCLLSLPHHAALAQQLYAQQSYDGLSTSLPSVASPNVLNV